MLRFALHDRLFVPFTSARVLKTWNYLALSGVLARILTSSSNDTSADSSGMASVVAPFAIGLVNLAAYNETHEQEIIDLYSSGKPLPTRIQQRIKKKDLQPYD